MLLAVMMAIKLMFAECVPLLGLSCKIGWVCESRSMCRNIEHEPFVS